MGVADMIVGRYPAQRHTTFPEVWSCVLVDPSFPLSSVQSSGLLAPPPEPLLRWPRWSFLCLPFPPIPHPLRISRRPQAVAS